MDKRALWIIDFRAAIYAGNSQSGSGVNLAKLISSVGPCLWAGRPSTHPFPLLHTDSETDLEVIVVLLQSGACLDSGEIRHGQVI